MGTIGSTIQISCVPLCRRSDITLEAGDRSAGPGFSGGFSGMANRRGFKTGLVTVLLNIGAVFEICSGSRKQLCKLSAPVVNCGRICSAGRVHPVFWDGLIRFPLFGLRRFLVALYLRDPDGFFVQISSKDGR